MLAEKAVFQEDGHEAHNDYARRRADGGGRYAYGRLRRDQSVRGDSRSRFPQPALGRAEDAVCLAVASYVLDPEKRDLGRKVPKVRQDHHDSVAAAMSVPVDHSSSLEVTVLRAAVGRVEAIANALFLEPGVRHGHLSLVPLAQEIHPHSHGDGSAHVHLRVVDRFEPEDRRKQENPK